jgi:hypothetical protein
MTHNHNTRAKALISGGCVIFGEINFDYRTFFLNNGVLSDLLFSQCTLRLSSLLFLPLQNMTTLYGII